MAMTTGNLGGIGGNIDINGAKQQADIDNEVFLDVTRGSPAPSRQCLVSMSRMADGGDDCS